jgi:hypothetical protein
MAAPPDEVASRREELSVNGINGKRSQRGPSGRSVGTAGDDLA